MRANEEDAGLAGGFLGRRGRGAFDVDSDPECPESVVEKRHGEEGAGSNAETGEEEANGDPKDGK